jgi:hypothetical protein
MIEAPGVGREPSGGYFVHVDEVGGEESRIPSRRKRWLRGGNAEVFMMSHFFDPDGLLRAHHHTRVTLRAITRPGNSNAFGIEVEHVFRADLETFTVVLAFARVYSRKEHVLTLSGLAIKVGPIDQR